MTLPSLTLAALSALAGTVAAAALIVRGAGRGSGGAAGVGEVAVIHFSQSTYTTD